MNIMIRRIMLIFIALGSSLKTFKAPFGNPDFLHRRTVPAVSANISSKYFTILIFEQFIVGVKWHIRRMRRFTCKAR